MENDHKPILCMDFDGVIHSYSSGWQGVGNANDDPVPGAMEFIADATRHFRVAVFSSRSSSGTGRIAMRQYVRRHMRETFPDNLMWAETVLSALEWPHDKPPAKVSIDDRAITFTGVFPEMASLRAFQPWNKKEGV